MPKAIIWHHITDEDVYEPLCPKFAAAFAWGKAVPAPKMDTSAIAACYRCGMPQYDVRGRMTPRRTSKRPATLVSTAEGLFIQGDMFLGEQR